MIVPPAPTNEPLCLCSQSYSTSVPPTTQLLVVRIAPVLSAWRLPPVSTLSKEMAMLHPNAFLQGGPDLLKSGSEVLPCRAYAV